MKIFRQNVLFFVLLLGGLFPQIVTGQVSRYTFSQTTSTYTPIVGGTNMVLPATATSPFDNEIFWNNVNGDNSLSVTTSTGFPIGFSFTYNGTAYTQFVITPNGFITLGTASTATTITSSTTTNNIIAPLGRDLVASRLTTGSGTSGTNTITVASASGINVGDRIFVNASPAAPLTAGTTVTAIVGTTLTISQPIPTTFSNQAINVASNDEISYVTTGTAPNRVLTVQWKNVRRFGVSADVGADRLNFQVKLHETSNKISVVYGSFTLGTGLFPSIEPIVGLRGTSMVDLNTRTTSTNWAATTASGLYPSGITELSSRCTLTQSIFPSANLTFEWLPATLPYIAVNTGMATNTISALQTVCEEEYDVSGGNLTGNVVLTAPTNCQISLTTGGTFSSSITLTPTAGTLAATKIYVKSIAAVAANSYITHTSTGAVTKTLAVTATGASTGTAPTVTLGTIPSVTIAAVSFSIPYTASTGSPNRYSINTVAPNPLPSFTPVVLASHTFVAGGSTIPSITIPASAAGTYNFEMIVRVNSTGCISAIIPFTLTVGTSPTITTTGTLTAFSACAGTVSTSKNYTVSGSNLTSNLVITAPTGYEISLTAGSGYASSLTLTPTAGTVSSTTIFARLTNTASGSPVGNITHTSTGATTQNVAVSGTVNPLPTVAAITGTTTACVGGTTTLSNATAGGTWSSSNTSIATVNASGVVTGVAAGTATISYAVTTSGCTTTQTTTVTINANPTVAAITGTTTACVGGTTTLSNATAGGTWSSSNTSVATINASGLVTGVAAGTTTISYTVTTSGCTTTQTTTVTINANPTVAAITGTTTACVGGTTTLSNATAGGTWSSSNTSVATINASGLVTGVAAGTTTISYTVTTLGCTTTQTTTVTINANPTVAAITGTTTACVGGTTTLSNATAGGTWSSSNTSIATVNASGVVTGVAAGTATISYAVTTAGCTTTQTTTVTINANPTVAAITGTTTACVGGTTTLSNATAGGTWSSSNTSIATVNASGVVTGVAAGTATISYAVTTAGCTTTQTTTVTINANPTVAAITGTTTACVGSTTTLSNATAGGTWSSSNISIATVNASGVVTGVAAGTATISYAVTTSGCTTTQTTTVTINANPTVAAITGTTTTVVGGTTTLSSATAGGTWSSSNISIATVNASGVVTGVAAGTATISYAVTASGCTTTVTTSVIIGNAPTIATSGTLTAFSACTSTASSSQNYTVSGANLTSNFIITAPTGYEISLTAGSGYASSLTLTPTAGTVNSTTIFIRLTNTASGSPAGNITHTSTGATTQNVAVSGTVNPLPTVATITGTTTACVGGTTTLSNATAGGTWSSSNTSIATVNASGVVTGVAAGTATISYSVTTAGCTTTQTTTVTINANPTVAAITGTTTACVGSTTTLSNATAGGTWSSSNTSIATVNASGVVTGVAAGTATISYSVTTAGCTTTQTTTVTINANPTVAAITGTTTACVGGTTALSNATAGGTWSSSNTSIATVNASGVVTGVAAGTATISYAVTTAGCTTTQTTTVTINANPTVAAITGTTTACVGGTTTLSNATVGGTWSSSNTSIATVNASGVVTGVAAGTATISYAVTTSGCTTTQTTTVTINANPTVAAITGTTIVAIASNTTLSSATAGGAWSSSNTSIATIDASGVVTGVAAGTATISYTVTVGSCVASTTTTITVATPNIIYVRTDGNDANNGFTNTSTGAKLTLQGGIGAVNDGGTIVLNAGTYNETATVTGKGFNLMGVGNPTIQTINMNAAGKTITLTGAINISEVLNLQAGDVAANGNLTLLATATKQAMIINNGTTSVTGNVTVQRYLRANTGTTGAGYRFVSSPVTTANWTQLTDNISLTVNPAFNTSATPGRVTPFPTVFEYDATKAGDPSKTFTTSPHPDFDKGWQSPNALTDNLAVGKGYTVNTSANQLIDITGTLNNTPVGNITVPVVTGNAASLGYNLIGNPYPSPIKWSAVLGLSSGVNDAVYQHVATGQYTGSWATYINGVGTNGGSDDIAVMQGFFVIANAGGNVVMNNSVRATSFANPNSFRTEDTQSNERKGLVRLNITNAAGKTDETVVYFTDNATDKFDSKFDAVKFQLNAGNFPNIYTGTAKSLYAINALPSNQLNDDVVVPVIVQSWTGGKQKITLTEKLNFTRNITVYLKDKLTNTLFDLANGSYDCNVEAGVTADRFELVFQPQFTTAEANGDNINLFPNPTTDLLTISVGSEYKGEVTIRLMDVAGRIVATETAQKDGKFFQATFNLADKASGVYLIEVQSNVRTVKRVVRN